MREAIRLFQASTGVALAADFSGDPNGSMGFERPEQASSWLQDRAGSAAFCLWTGGGRTRVQEPQLLLLPTALPASLEAEMSRNLTGGPGTFLQVALAEEFLKRRIPLGSTFKTSRIQEEAAGQVRRTS